VVVSDFGNNVGLLLGPAINDWRATAFAALTCESWVDERCVGEGGALALPGGPLAAVAFALGRCARRGLPLKAGYVISTGAATGIHDIRIGQSARVRFAGVGELACRAVPAAQGAARSSFNR
jgi:2-keto-4-pentenoate hydratase